METVVSKLCNIKRTREIMNLKMFFRKFRENCKAISSNMLAEAAVKKVKSAVSSIIRIYKKNRLVSLRSYLLKYQLINEAMKFAKEKKQKLEEKYKKVIVGKDKEINSLEEKAKLKLKEINVMKKTQKSLKEKLKQEHGVLKDSKKGKYSEEYIKSLKGKVRELQRDNKVLKEEWNATENSVENFVQEITEMIESQEFARN